MLLAGILTGVITSQAVMVLLMRFFGVEGVSFQFVFSEEAFIWTFIYFFAIFVLLLLWNLIRSYRFSLINLLKMERKNEKIIDVGGWGNFFIFILACGLLYYAYTLIYDSMFLPNDPRFSKSILFGYIGNLLFFRSLAGALKIFGKSNKKHYYKGLNMFTYRQLGSNIRTAYFSMAQIAILLLIALGSLISGNVINTGLNQMKNANLPYDMTLEIFGLKTEDPEMDIGELLKDNGLDLERYTSDYNNYYVYYMGEPVGEEVPFLNKLAEQSGGGRYMLMSEQQGKIISYSSYRMLQEALGETPIEIDEGEVLILNNSTYIQELLDEHNDSMKATLYNKEYQIHKKAGKWNISSDVYAMDQIVFVLPDQELEGHSPYSLVFNMDYGEGYGPADFDIRGEDIIGQIQDILFAQIPGDVFHGKGFFYQDKESQLQGMEHTSLMIIFVVAFLGLMFMIFSGAILAVQQLSRQTENRRRYKTLMILGADDRDMKRSMLLQHVLYFLIPMGLAIIHSIAGVRALYIAFFALGGESFTIHASLTMTVAVLGIYVLYMIMTYQSGKGILKEKS